jgi:hypothetical protein
MAEPGAIIRLAGADAERCAAAMEALSPAIAAIVEAHGEITTAHALLNLYLRRQVALRGGAQAAMLLIGAARGLLQREGADAAG